MDGSAERNFGTIFAQDFKRYRDELILSSKAGYDMWPGPYGQGGGSRKYLISSLDQSLKRMGVEYVDIFYSHRFDDTTPLEETMGALDSIARSGKALSVGISSYSGQRTREGVKILQSMGTPLLIRIAGKRGQTLAQMALSWVPIPFKVRRFRRMRIRSSSAWLNQRNARIRMGSAGQAVQERSEQHPAQATVGSDPSEETIGLPASCQAFMPPSRLATSRPNSASEGNVRRTRPPPLQVTISWRSPARSRMWSRFWDNSPSGMWTALGACPASHSCCSRMSRNTASSGRSVTGTSGNRLIPRE